MTIYLIFNTCETSFQQRKKLQNYLSPFLWQNNVVVKGLKNLSVLGMNRDQHLRLHSLNHVFYLIIVQVTRRMDLCVGIQSEVR